MPVDPSTPPLREPDGAPDPSADEPGPPVAAPDDPPEPAADAPAEQPPDADDLSETTGHARPDPETSSPAPSAEPADDGEGTRPGRADDGPEATGRGTAPAAPDPSHAPQPSTLRRWTGAVHRWAAPPPRPTVDPMPGEDPHEPVVDRLARRLLGASYLLTRVTRRERLMGWVWPLAVTLLGGVLRFWRLGTPHALVFDETYYVKEGYSLLARGYEADWGPDPNPRFEAGDTSMLSTNGFAERVVHPMVGKWLIAAGIRLGGGVGSSFAWRLAIAVAGTLAILMVARIGRRLFASTALGTLAGLFLAVDGMGIVMSRTSVLDQFLMVFVLGAFALLLIDRDQSRRRLARRVAALVRSGEPMSDLGPRLGVRWWRLAAAVLLGLACGVKWSGVYFLAVFGLMSVAWDATARYRVGVRRWFVGAVVLDGIVAGVAMVAITAATYVATWTSWFLSDHADYRQWASQHPGELTSWTLSAPQLTFGHGGHPLLAVGGGRLFTLDTSWVPPELRSWWAWHRDTWTFHNGLETPHPYAAGPAGWIIQLRPTSFYYTELKGDEAQAACHADVCSRAVTSLGNPLVWWLGAAAIIVALVWLLWFRDWRAGAVLSGLAAGWLPWLAYAHRTIFTFYAIAFLPWVVLTLTYVVGLVVGPKDEVDPRTRRITLAVVSGVVVVLVLAVSAFFYPIWTAWPIPRGQWQLRMWLPTWI